MRIIRTSCNAINTKTNDRFFRIGVHKRPANSAGCHITLRTLDVKGRESQTESVYSERSLLYQMKIIRSVYLSTRFANDDGRKFDFNYS